MTFFSIRDFSTVLLSSLVISLSLLNMPALADQLSTTISYASPEIVATDGFHRVSLNGTDKMESAGAPSLPSDVVWFALPPGHQATSFQVTNQVWRSVPGEYIIEPTQQAQRLSSPQIAFTEPDPAIYQSEMPYPPHEVSGLSTHLKRGIAMATCIVHPVRWSPMDGTVEYLASADITLITSSSERSETSYESFYRGDRQTFDWTASQVVNPEVLWQYPRRDNDAVPSMLIVTSQDLMEAAEEYAYWHKTRGLPTIIQTVENYINGYEGVDIPERIRNGIISAYQTSDINYLLLLGDVQYIPPRLLIGTVDFENEDSLAESEGIPADFYFSALDGNWNADGDTLWGEVDEADLMAELAVGRIPADDVADVRNMLRKIKLYSDEPVTDDVLRVMSLGEDLGWNVWGGDYMDEVYGGSREWGRFTLGYNNWFHYYHRVLYDRIDTWSAIEDLAPQLSEGYHYIHHLGHANETHVMKFDGINDGMVTNDGIENGFNITYTQGCHAGNFEYDGFAEQFTVKMQYGSVAYIGNSRYGWGSTNNTNGPSQHFHREFVDALMGEHITQLGRTQQDSKEDVAGRFSQNDLIRWCYYTSNLLGDPALDAWTNVPTEMDPDYNIVIPINHGTYRVVVEDTPNANVCLSRDGNVIAVGYTNEQGIAVITLTEPIVPTGALTLSVVAHNRIPFKTEIYSISDTEGFPWVEELQLTDTGGIEDGQANPGEIVEISPSVHNLGNVPLADLTVSAETKYPSVRIIRSETRFERINSGERRLPVEPFVIAIDTTCGDLHGVDLELTFEDASGNSWKQDVFFTTHAPLLNGRYLTVLDRDGNNNGHLDPGEEAEILFSVVNNGSGRGNNVTAILQSGNPLVEVLEGESRLNVVAPNVVADFNLSFRVSVSEDCPDPYRAIFYVSLTGDRGLRINHLVDVPIGGTYYNFDGDDEEWEHRPVNHQYGDQWHLSNDNHSYNGRRSIKAGHPEPGREYAQMLNSAMYMPAFEVTEPLELVFWHKIDAEASRNNEGAAYDGGWLEVQVDNRGWDYIYPGGSAEEPHYPYEILVGARTPLTEGQQVFSGTHDWDQVFFDLSEFIDHTIQIRFRFGSDEGIGNGGWWIDDIELRMPVSIEAPTDLAADPVRNGTLLTWNTPMMPRRDDDYHGPDVLTGYRVYRQYENNGFPMLDTLVTSNQFVDELFDLEDGECSYYVTAEYITGESDPTNTVTVNWVNSVNDSEEPLPNNWAIGSAYPNPFNSSTRIAYSVPTVGEVSITVFDIAGRQVREILNSNQLPGHHEIVFNGFDLPSGMYLVKMGTPVGFKSTKILLIR